MFFCWYGGCAGKKNKESTMRKTLYPTHPMTWRSFEEEKREREDKNTKLALLFIVICLHLILIINFI